MQSANSRLPLQPCLQNKGEIYEKLVTGKFSDQFLQKGVSRIILVRRNLWKSSGSTFAFSSKKMKDFCFIRACILFWGVDYIMSHIDQFTGTPMFISAYNSDNIYVLVI